MKPRELKTEYLNLTQLNESNNGEDHRIQDPKVQKLMDVLRTKKKIVVIAGAGISVSAGGMCFFYMILLSPALRKFLRILDY